MFRFFCSCSFKLLFNWLSVEKEKWCVEVLIWRHGDILECRILSWSWHLLDGLLRWQVQINMDIYWCLDTFVLASVYIK